jgi:hypothetical protein
MLKLEKFLTLFIGIGAVGGADEERAGLALCLVVGRKSVFLQGLKLIPKDVRKMYCTRPTPS